ncbi:MAG: Nramp family divalent metal transporter [Flavobacteriaceae bacterium]|nr:Nramp family divalent metal transporter [Flavobacteriaceae bacterium]
MFLKWFKNIGPGTLVAAAFIGPGTVTVCTIAGVTFGYNLLWVMLLSIFATIILQEMSARIGIISQKGLSEVLRNSIENKKLKYLVVALILAAIVVGNAAYEAGNISGGILGLETIFGTSSYTFNNITFNGYSLLIGVVAFVLLYIGNYKFLEKALITLVILMSISFIVTAALTKPNLSALFSGLFIPKMPEQSILTIIALIGTTVVPYNIFLHASLVKEKWNNKNDLKKAKLDTILSIALGGLVSMAIIIAASGINSKEILNTADLAKGLEPLYGEFAKYFLALGLFAAGITSAITAPLAAAYVAKGCLGFKGGLTSISFRAVWIIILGLGVVFSSIGIKPIEIIKFAQIANGILLPIITGLLLWMMNNSAVLGNYVNTKLQNVFAVLIFIVTVFLGTKGVLTVLNVI